MSDSKDKVLHASTRPVEDIERIAYNGQAPDRKMYHSGYEKYFGEMPQLEDQDEFIVEKTHMSAEIMQHLAHELENAGWVVRENIPGPSDFNRTIIALEAPEEKCEHGICELKEGHEFVVAKWGDNFSSPVHGHTAGYLHEEILHGKMRVNTYRMTSHDSVIVRPVQVQIVTKGTFASLYTKANPTDTFKRQALIHNFTSIGFSATLHYLSEHVRDGRDNRFEVEYFDDVYNYGVMDLTRVTGQQAMYSKIGTVLLVRSENVPELSDHYIIITGAPVMKTHGLRPQDHAIPAPNNKVLGDWPLINGLTLLKLNEKAQQAFLEFHNIVIDGKEVIFPL